MLKHTILFLAANPIGTDRIALDEEARAIHQELERSGHRDKFELVTRWAVRPLDLLRELRKLKPTIVHFSGHGGRGKARQGMDARRDVGEVGGLFFQGSDGQPQLVSTAVLEETFGAAGQSVKLVVLGACYSDEQAEALLSRVDCVVGVGGSISDEAARNFAVGFYGGIAERESVATAYRQGCVAIKLEGLPDSERLQFNVRPGVDIDRLFLADGLDGSSAARELLGWVNHDTDPMAVLHPIASRRMHLHRDETPASEPDRGPDRGVVLAPVLAQPTSPVSPRPLSVDRGEIPDKGRARRLAPVPRSTDGNEASGVDDQRVSSALPLPALPSAARLVVMRGNDTGQLLEIGPGKTYKIGRGIDNDLVLTDITVSRKHFDLRYENGAWILVDRASGNGTVINDKIEDGPYMLESGDTIEVGTTVFRFDVITAAASIVGSPRERPSREAPAADVWVRRFVHDWATLELLLGVLQARRRTLCEDDPERAKIDQLIGALEVLQPELREEQRPWDEPTV